MSSPKVRSNKVRPVSGDITVVDNSDWGEPEGNAAQSQQPEFQWKRNQNARRRSFDAGNQEYAAYVERRMFNLRESWTPYLGQRMRNKHLAVRLNPTRGLEGFKHRWNMRLTSLKIRYREWNRDLEIWRKSLKAIEGHQGTGVVSYFIFLKWLFFLNIFIFLVMFWAIVFFQTAFPSIGYTRETTGSDTSATEPGVVLAENCSASYNVVIKDGFQVVLDFIQGTGWMEKTLFFYGTYTTTEVAMPTGNYNMPFAYFVVTLVIIVVSLGVMVHHTVSNYMEAIMSTDDTAKNAKHFFLISAGWDYSLCGDESVKLHQTRIFQMICSELAEQAHEKKTRASSRSSRCLLWTVRVMINLVIVVLLISAAVAIYFAQEFSTNLTNGPNADSYDPLVITMVEFLPSVLIGVLNGAFPLLFKLLVNFEDYRPSFVIKITLLRTVFVRFASVIVIVGTIYRKITCYPQNQCLVGTGDCPVIQCWETYVGQQIYKLLVVELAVDVLLTFLYELPRKLITTKWKHPLAQKIGPAEFDITINVLDLVYGQALCWFGFFFAPLIPAMCVIRMFLLFYLKKLSALYNTVPPERPYHAARSNAFFMVILLIAFFMVVIPLGYVLVQLQPSPMCGPYRIYSNPTEIINIQIGLANGVFRTVWQIVSSSALIVTAAIIMGLALYYCSAVRSASRELVKNLKKQLLQDEKDKQYLMARLSKLTNKSNSQETKPLLKEKAPLIGGVSPYRMQPSVPAQHTPHLINIQSTTAMDSPGDW